jgi:hypothetical protein
MSPIEECLEHARQCEWYAVRTGRVRDFLCNRYAGRRIVRSFNLALSHSILLNSKNVLEAIRFMIWF